MHSCLEQSALPRRVGGCGDSTHSRYGCTRRITTRIGCTLHHLPGSSACPAAGHHVKTIARRNQLRGGVWRHLGSGNIDPRVELAQKLEYHVGLPRDTS